MNFILFYFYFWKCGQFLSKTRGAIEMMGENKMKISESLVWDKDEISVVEVLLLKTKL